MSKRIQNKFYADREDAGERDIQHANDRLSIIQKIFERNEFDRILDTRCGNGSFTIDLSEKCGASDIYGFELYENKRKRANERGIKAEHLDLNNSHFPFQDNYFDAICAIDIIEHLYDPDHFLEEIHRTLSPNGTLILATPNLASWHNRLALLLGYQPFCENLSRRFPVGHLFENHSFIDDVVPPSSHHFRVFTLRAILELLEIYEFETIDIIGASAVIPKTIPLYSVVSKIEELSTAVPSLSFEIVITAHPIK